MIFVRNVVQERTGLRIDQPDPSGGTTSTGSVARRAFSAESQFIECVSSLVEPQYKEALSKLHTQISAILRIFNSDRKVNTNELGKLCKSTYLLKPKPELTSLNNSSKCANSLCNVGVIFAHGNDSRIKCFSEEGSEACNKLIRKYREHLARKTSSEDNMIDIFVRLACESDPVILGFRSKLV